jgi:hypothetical protein
MRVRIWIGMRLFISTYSPGSFPSQKSLQPRLALKIFLQLFLVSQNVMVRNCASVRDGTWDNNIEEGRFRPAIVVTQMLFTNL